MFHYRFKSHFTCLEQWQCVMVLRRAEVEKSCEHCVHIRDTRICHRPIANDTTVVNARYYVESYSNLKSIEHIAERRNSEMHRKVMLAVRTNKSRCRFCTFEHITYAYCRVIAE